jgi:hypothetical protein
MRHQSPLASTSSIAHVFVPQDTYGIAKFSAVVLLPATSVDRGRVHQQVNTATCVCCDPQCETVGWWFRNQYAAVAGYMHRTCVIIYYFLQLINHLISLRHRPRSLVSLVTMVIGYRRVE